MIDLLPSFGNIAFTLAAFVVALSVIVAVHEYGHYIVGRWCGIKAEVFSLGFGPVLWARPDKHGTVWQIAALPFGGYVKFLGDANAASVGDDGSVDDMDPALKRQTMLGAPLWARAATVAAGPVFNFILSILIFGVFAMSSGKVKEPVEIAEMLDLPPSFGVFEPGDVVLEMNGLAVESLSDLSENIDALPLAGQIDYVVERGGRQVTVAGPYPLPPMVGSISIRSAADDAGLEIGDVITAIDGQGIETFSQLQKIVMASEGRQLTLGVWRAGQELEFSFATKRGVVPTDDGLEERWLIGMGSSLPFVPATGSLGVVEALDRGVSETFSIITRSLSGLRSMIVGDISTCNLSGPVGIARASGATASMGLATFILFVATISTAVGLLNLFPIPVLDGGHLVFHAYEAVTGKPPSEGALRLLMGTGLALIGALMVFALTNDFTCP